MPDGYDHGFRYFLSVKGEKIEIDRRQGYDQTSREFWKFQNKYTTNS